MVEIPKTSKAAVLEEYGKPLQILEVPIPEVEPRGILVKVEMAGICGTDVHQQRGELTIKEPFAQHTGTRDHRKDNEVGRRSYSRRSRRTPQSRGPHYVGPC